MTTDTIHWIILILQVITLLLILFGYVRRTP